MPEKIKLSELQAIEETITTAPRTMTAGEVATQAVKNIPGSAIQYGTEVSYSYLYQVSKLMNNKQKLLVNILLTDMVVWKI
jgi:hypothetical protein